MENSKRPVIAVVGGMNLDVTGSVSAPLRARDSNLGAIRFAPGGVGRNIAERLARAGVHAKLYTCVSDDFVGQLLEAACRDAGIDLSMARRVHGRGSCYMSVHGADGDMAVAVNDMALMESLTVPYLETVLPDLNRADACVVEANLSMSCIAYLAEHLRVPVVADPVSGVKADRLRPLLGRLDALKPNRDEALLLTGEATCEAAAQALLKLGVKRVILSMGADGVYYADDTGAGTIAPAERFTCQATGAGDAMCAGIALALAENGTARDCADRGMRMSQALLRARQNGETEEAAPLC